MIPLGSKQNYKNLNDHNYHQYQRHPRYHAEGHRSRRGCTAHLANGLDALYEKIFADKEEEWEITIEGYQSPIPDRLKWQTWAANEEGLTGDALMDFINNELFPALKELDFSISPQAKIIRSVFEDTYNYMKTERYSVR